MALVKQNIEVPFGLGLDTQTDAKLVLPGKLVELENARFDKRGRVAKCTGIEAFNIAGDVGRMYSDGNVLAVRGVASSNVPVVTRNDIAQSFGTTRVFPRLEGETLFSTPVSVRTTDAALDTTGRKIGLCVTTPATGNGNNYAFFDFDTKRVIVRHNITATTPRSARVLPRGTTGTFIVGTYNGTTLDIIDNVTMANPFGSGGASIATLNTTPHWDWCLLGNILYVVTFNNAGTTITLSRYDITTWAAPTTANIVVAPTALTVAVATGGRVGVFYTTAAGVFFRGYNPTTLALDFTTTVINTAGTYELITAHSFGSGGWSVAVQESVAPAATYNRRVVYGVTGQIDASLLVPLSVAGCGLATKINGTNAGCVYDTVLQRTLLFRRLDNSPDVLTGAGNAELLGRIFYGTHGGLIQQQCLPQLQEISAEAGASVYNRDLFCSQMTSLPSTQTAAVTTPQYGAAWVQAQQHGGSSGFAGGRPYPHAVIGGRSIFGGGYLHTVDPRGVRVHGLLLYPEIVSATPVAAGGSLADGGHSVTCTYEYTDSDGQVFESEPAPPVLATVAGGGGAGRIDMVVQNYRIEPLRDDVYIVFYRALPGTTIYYREARVLASSTANSTSQSLTTAAATLDDAARLYTIGGEEPNAQPDAPIAICADQDRIWVTPGSARNRVLPSKPNNVGEGIAFFPERFREVASQGDAIVSLARQDGKILAFKRNTTHIANGDGPDRTGAADNLSEFAELFRHVGAARIDHVLSSSLGIYVKSATDIWFIGRDLQLNRIGADVESYTSSSMESCAYITSNREARFVFGSEGQACFELVYFEDEGSWSYNPRTPNDTLPPAIAYFNDRAHYLFSIVGGGGAGLYRENPAVFTNDGVGYALKLVTAWLKPSQAIQGYGRIYRAMLLGESKSSHTLQVRVRYDYSSTWSETHTITSAAATNADGVWQPEIMFGPGSACEAFQLEISETGPTGESFNISGLLLEVGVKPGKFRGRASKRL